MVIENSCREGRDDGTTTAATRNMDSSAAKATRTTKRTPDYERSLPQACNELLLLANQPSSLQGCRARILAPLHTQGSLSSCA